MALIGHISGSKQSNSAIGISGSVIIANRPSNLFPSIAGSDVAFFVSGSSNGTDLAVFGGDLTSSGSLAVKNASGASVFNVASSTGNATVGGTLNVVASITGSSSLTIGGALVGTGATQSVFTTTTNSITFGGTAITTNIAVGNAFGGGTKTVNLGTASTGSTTTVNIGSTGGANNSIVLGGGSGTTALTLGGGSGANTINIGVTSATGTINIGGTVGTTTLNSNVVASRNVTITGDLTVNGTTTTINTNNLEVKDSVIGLGFASGTVGQSGGDRGLILGLGNSPHATFLWKHAESEFAVGSTTSSATGSLPIALSSYSNFHANNIQGSIVSASLGFSGSLTTLIDGTSYIIAGNNITVTSGANGSITIDGSASGAPSGAQYLVLQASGGLTDERIFSASTGLKFTDGGANGNYVLSIDDSVVATVSGTTFQGTIKPSTNNFYDLGATGSRWYRGYIDQISGSHTQLIDGTSAFIAGAGISIATGSNGAITFSAVGGGGDVFGPGSATDGAVALFDTATGKLLKNSLLTSNVATDALFIAGNLGVSGSITLGDSTADTVSFTARVNTNVVPSADMTYELGSADLRWAHVYTGDLHLRNDRGDYTLIEEEDFLSIRFNKTGKRYKFVLEAVPELDEDPVIR